MWFFLAFASAFFYSFRRISEKRLSQKINHFLLGWAVQAFSLPGTVLLLFFATIPSLSSLSSNFWIPLLIIWIFLYPIQAYFYYKSLKHGDVSYILPLFSLVPIFNIVTSWVLLGEIPSIVGFLGILSIVVGIYSLNMKSGMNLFSPFAALFRNKLGLFMIINCLSLAFGSTLDKIAVQASNPLFYSFVNTVGATIVLFIFARKTNSNLESPIKNNYKELTIIGILQALAFTLYIFALNTGIVAYVAAIKSASAILGSVWGFVFLKEKLNRYKVIALIFISFGLLFIGLG